MINTNKIASIEPLRDMNLKQLLVDDNKLSCIDEIQIISNFKSLE